MRDHGIETREPPRSAALCRCPGNPARARRNGSGDSLHPAGRLVRARSEKTKCRRRAAGLRLVSFYVANRKQINRTAGQSESECRQRWRRGGGRHERQTELEIAAKYLG